MSNTKRNSKRKTRMPNRFKDSVCSLNNMKKDDEIGTKKGKKNKARVNNDSLGKDVDKKVSCMDDRKDDDSSMGKSVENTPEVSTRIEDVQTPKSNVSDSTLPVNVQQAVKTCNVEDMNIANAKTANEHSCGVKLGNKCKPIGVNSSILVDKSVADELNVMEKQNTRSFAELVSSSNDKNNNKLDFVPPDIDEKGAKIVIFVDDLVREGCKKWVRTVCGYFVRLLCGSIYEFA